MFGRLPMARSHSGLSTRMCQNVMSRSTSRRRPHAADVVVCPDYRACRIVTVNVLNTTYPFAFLLHLLLWLHRLLSLRETRTPPETAKKYTLTLSKEPVTGSRRAKATEA